VKEPTLLKRNLAVVTAILIAVIVYGSLYPFAFQIPATGSDPLPHLLATWANHPGRGDFLSNIVLYMPLGFIAARSFRDGTAAWQRLVLVTILGATLSFAMEYTQYFDQGRDSTLLDVYTNTTGTILGAIGGLIFGTRFTWPVLSDLAAEREASMLLAAWLGYRLFPYVPAIDLHKYWDAMKPVVLHPSLTPYDLFRQTTIWLTIFLLIEAIFRHRRPLLFILLFAAGVLFAKMLIIGAVLSLAEVTGAALAVALWLILGANDTLRRITITLLFLGLVTAQRLEPFAFGPAGGFTWIPFYSFMQGSIDVDVQSFFEKFFLYGSLIWLLVRLRFTLSLATLVVALLLFATSGVEIYLPGRSAEITDGVMALAIGVIAALARRSPAKPATAQPAPLI
jgi:VanZ family protein